MGISSHHGIHLRIWNAWPWNTASSSTQRRIQPKGRDAELQFPDETRGELGDGRGRGFRIMDRTSGAIQRRVPTRFPSSMTSEPMIVRPKSAILTWGRHSESELPVHTITQQNGAEGPRIRKRSRASH